MKSELGFIGLGIMGKPMARNLMKAGYPIIVYDIRPESVEEIRQEGAQRASSCKEVAENCDIVITMVPDSADSEAAILGPNGVLAGCRPETIILDMSSIAPLVSQKIAAECAKKGVEMLDAPVSGGEPGAINATLAIMVGGKKEIFDRTFDIMKTVGSNVTLCGAIGAGNTTKLANQIIVALNIAAVGEALVLAAKAGVDPETVFQAIRGGLAGSTVLDAKAPMIISRNFKPGFRIRLHQKDLNNALATAKELNVPLPFTALVQQVITALVNDGKADSDHSAIATFIEGMAGIEVKKLG